MTGDMARLLDLLESYIEMSGRPFQFVLGDIHQLIYDSTGKVDDPDINEIGNDEYKVALLLLLKDMRND